MKNILTLRFLAISILIIGVSLLLACGGSATKNANTTNSNSSGNSNSANSNANSNTAVATSDKPPLTTTLDELQLLDDFLTAKEFPNRMVTATGRLVFVSDNTKEITLSYSNTVYGNTVVCKGDFSKYSDIKKRIDDAVKQNKAPQAIVKGSVAKEQTEKELILDPCVLADIKAP